MSKPALVQRAELSVEHAELQLSRGQCIVVGCVVDATGCLDAVKRSGGEMVGTEPASASEHPATWKFDYEVFHAETLQDLRAWLAARHGDSPGVWFVTWKADTGRPAVAYDDLVEELLCWGWIDSTINRLDDERLLQLCTPRKPRSTWTRLNRDRVRRMDEAGRMQAAGWAAVEVAKENGWWTIYDPVEDLVVPVDLRAALDATPAAAAFFDDEVPPSAKKGMLWQVYSAVRPATREKRIATIVSEAAEGRRAYH